MTARAMRTPVAHLVALLLLAGVGLCPGTYSPPTECLTPVWEHLPAEVYTGTLDCNRGTIMSDAAAAGLPLEDESYDISVEFSCNAAVVGDVERVLWVYGKPEANSALGLAFQPSTQAWNYGFNHFWYGSDALWQWSSDGLGLADVCNNNFHTVRVSWDGSTRRFYYDGVEKVWSFFWDGEGTTPAHPG